MSKVDFKLTNYGFKNQNLGGRTVFTKMVLLPATSILRITVAAATILQDPTNNCGHRDACCSDTDIFSKYTAAESSRYKNTTN